MSIATFRTKQNGTPSQLPAHSLLERASIFDILNRVQVAEYLMRLRQQCQFALRKCTAYFANRSLMKGRQSERIIHHKSATTRDVFT